MFYIRFQYKFIAKTITELRKLHNYERMEEKEDHQQKDFLYPNFITIEAQKLRIKCLHNNQAQYACIDPKCEVAGLMCMDSNCKCREAHFRCHQIILDRVLKSIQSHQKQLPKTVKDSYKQVYQNINSMIDQLSEIREKLQKQESNFGLTDQELKFIELINENKLEQVSGKIVSLLEQTFEAQISFKLATKEKIINEFKQKRTEFDKICKFIEDSFSKQKFRQKKVKESKLIDSKIITEKSDKYLIRQWVIENSNLNNPEKQISYNLLFRASQHEFKAAQFHRLCDGISNTLIIVKSQNGKVFGGFTQKAWSYPQRRTNVVNDQKKAFMFSLATRQKYQCTNLRQSIKSDRQYGPIFGGGCDLYICNRCNQEERSGVNTFCSYNLKDNKYEARVDSNNKAFAGCTSGNNFKVKQYEVYQIKGL